VIARSTGTSHSPHARLENEPVLPSINLERPDYAQIDGFMLAVKPQIYAGDERSDQGLWWGVSTD
jgi:hypothetical protein